ncbi:MAG: type II toxin-antitoxin system HicB family antitoxin [bacterium]
MKWMVPLVVEMEREEDGRWIADIPALPGVIVYGSTAEEARAKVQTLALLVLIDRLANED